MIIENCKHCGEDFEVTSETYEKIIRLFGDDFFILKCPNCKKGVSVPAKN